MLSSPQTENPVPQKSRGMFAFLRPEPPAPPMQGSPQEIKKEFRYWQNRILISSLIGYALFYFVRKNIGIAMPFMEKSGISKSELGLFLTLHGVLYGVSKFANGFLADRANARTMMAVGLILSAIANFFFGFTSAVVVLGVVWMLNGWFQGIGFPPCARLMTHWFSPKELATKMSIWNTSHSIGAALVLVLCGYLLKQTGNWRLCFIVPGVIALFGSVFLFFALRDTPRSLGLPEVEGTESAQNPGSETAETSAEFKAFLRKKVFGNPYIWIIALANFFVYTVRYSVLDWGPTLLHEFKGFDIAKAGWMTAAFEISGVAGMLMSGWLTDKIFKGRGARTCVICMALTAISVLVFWKLPANSLVLNTSVLCCAGFFIYGPQALVGISVANLATKRAAATAVGLTGIFGYASAILSGWGLGKLVEMNTVRNEAGEILQHGWSAGFAGILIMAAIGTLLFAFAWPAKADGYEN
jgi:OPA family glycerol-3-phosphate transporter-like MFS transporter/OPA family sugar phosphate sensor protein UhpC-like MFS transporter